MSKESEPAKDAPMAAQAPGAWLIAAARGDELAVLELADLIAGDRTVKSLRELAEWFGVTLITIKTGWRKAGDMPGREGSWPLKEILRWKLQRDVVPRLVRERERLDGDENALGRKRLAEARKAEADAAAKELKNEVAMGNLLYRDDVEREVTEHIAVVRHTLGRIPALMKPRLPKKIAQDVSNEIRDEIERALTTLADLPSTITRGMEADAGVNE